jgi:hypothetical protein
VTQKPARKIQHLIEDVGLDFDEVVFLDVSDIEDEASHHALDAAGRVVDQSPEATGSASRSRRSPPTTSGRLPLQRGGQPPLRGGVPRALRSGSVGSPARVNRFGPLVTRRRGLASAVIAVTVASSPSLG